MGDAPTGALNPKLLAERAEALARRHREAGVTTGSPRGLLRELVEAGASLVDTYELLARAAARGVETGPAAHWLLDNFYVLRDQRREVIRHLRGAFFRELPYLGTGPSAGRPRAYALADDFVAALDGSVGATNLTEFLLAYQRILPLRLAELWALPDALRIVLLLRLRRLAEQVRQDHLTRRQARQWAERIAAQAEAGAMEASWELKRLLDQEGAEVLSPPFLVALIDRLQVQGPDVIPIREWLEDRLTTLGVEVQDLTRQETQRQVSVGNAVAALRWSADARWGPLIERVSAIEHALQDDPSGVYPRMDLETRNLYRQRVERLARHAQREEEEVAAEVVARARGAPGGHPSALDGRHVGHYLVGEGAPAFARELGSRPPLRLRLLAAAEQHPGVAYLGTVALTTTVALLAALAVAAGRGISAGMLILVGLAAFLPLLDLGVAATNRLVAWLVPPRRLPKMDADTGLDDADRALIVIPGLLRSVEEAAELVEQLEIHARANPAGRFRFALLTDPPDAEARVMPGDAAPVEAARAAIRRLNAHDHDDWGDRFFLLHRERRWSPSERVWMGWERKRGKLEELNRLLCDPDAETSFTVVEGGLRALLARTPIRYVLTVDADTQLPPGSALDLVRTAAHPLNRPVYDRDAQRVTHGFGILQPRVSIHPASTHRSRFARIFSGLTGIDPYTTAVSDVYQDLFGEGIYTGKGLYDVDAFSSALAGVVPADTVLSHDLLESVFARAALVTDVEVFDDYPSGYLPWARRLHRWVRGDWQIARWLPGSVRGAAGEPRPNPITTLGRWQIVDNLRRSLTPPAMLVFLLVGWIALPRSPLFWSLVALAVLAFPVYVNLTSAVFARPRDVTWRSYFAGVDRDLERYLVQTGLTIVFLAHTAVVSLDAGVRALWRILVTRRGLLEWTTASDVERSAPATLGAYVRAMAPSILWTVASLALVMLLEPDAWIAAVPFLTAWIAAPFLGWWLSQPVEEREAALGAADHSWLRVRGRRTWSFFERFTNAQTGWLPPDNVQENPLRGAAPRTSPTNIGLGLLATQAAWDFGWVSQEELIERLEGAARTIDGLDTHAGHLFNWYDVRDGRTLWPRYVSTVDSGNLAACLVALAGGLHDVLEAPWPNPELAEGVRDTLALCAEHLESRGSGRRRKGELAEALADAITKALDARSDSAAGWARSVARLRPAVARLEAACGSSLPGSATLPSEGLGDPLAACVRSLGRLLRDEQRDLGAFVPASDGSEHDGAAGLAERQRRVSTDPPDDPVRKALSARVERLQALRRWCIDRTAATDFRALYDTSRDLFMIGLNLETLQPDAGHYDLLASEARLASFLAIAKGDVPVRHWFHLGRAATRTIDGSVLLSWSGSLFEYLMPRLLLGSWPSTLLDETCRGAVTVQRRYAERHGRPWGISESAYNTLNLDLDYQYRAFGVPGLGLKRGLSGDYVVAPYATALALMVTPRAARANLDRLEREGALGPWGFYESLDYTSERLPPGRSHAVVSTWMAHHQGMVLVSVANTVLQDVFRRRFHAAPSVRATELLLQERIPRRVEMSDPHPLETTVDPGDRPARAPAVAYVGHERLRDPSPRGHLLSNGRYSSLYTQAGTGGSWFGDWDLTRWSPDRVQDGQGVFVYVRDLDSGAVWSTTPAPTDPVADRLDTWFHLNKVESALVHDWIEAFSQVCVSPEDDVEVRRITVTNYSDRTRRLDLTSYAELALQQRGADAVHPAFSKLFVETEALPRHSALLATRRPRADDDPTLWMFHTVAQGSDQPAPEGPVAFETDRARFLGRGRRPAHPAALDLPPALSGTTGPVLDPVFSLRVPLTLGPGEKRVVSFTLGVAASRDAAIAMADRYDHPAAAARALDLATAYGPVEIQHAQLAGAEALRLQELGAAIAYQDPRLRAPAEVVRRNRRQQSALWAYGISGDRPIVLVHIASVEELDGARDAVRAFEYWQQKGLELDLVFLNEHPPSYVEGVQDLLTELVQASASRTTGRRRGALFVLRADQLPEEDRVLLQAVAHAVSRARLPVLRAEPRAVAPAGGVALEPRSPGTGPVEPPGAEDRLAFDNGIGGYDADGAYVIRLRPGTRGLTLPPQPWSNVLANEAFGTLVTETGIGATWAGNSREYRLTPWANDPVLDRPSDVVYVRDEESGRWGSATPAPAPFQAGYETRHRFGSTRYRVDAEELRVETTVFTAAGAPLTAVRLRLRNTSDRPRRLTVYRLHEWVLGVLRAPSARMVVTEVDPETDALLARRHYHPDQPEHVAFAHVLAPADATVHWTTDRAEFLGRMRDLSRPRAVEANAALEGRSGAGLDPCAAFRVELTVEPGAERCLYFLTGAAADLPGVHALLSDYGTHAALDEALDEVDEAWRGRLSPWRVHTPDPALDRLFDGWLLYQTWACRLWARSALYQSSGAFGFRDQLQDVMAVTYVRPALARSQILLHAAHQFVEGDVLHWWHPGTERGVRTRFSDDLLWLPHVSAWYVDATGDATLLDERVPFLTGRPLDPGEDEAYLSPEVADEVADLYEHCCRALDRSLTEGPHGLPLMGTGDWNDGMNRVGREGKGESVWLAFFLHATLGAFLPHVEARSDAVRATRYREARQRIEAAVQEAGWDGDWYRRAYFDDGTPLGAAENPECRIDAIAQAWAVLSGVAPPEESRTALESVERHLVDRGARLIRLLDPPFDTWEKDPGYIKGYVPGVRENGGQYTHGVLWLVAAWAELGDVDRALDLLSLLVPASHAADPAGVARYRVEPYVAAADVYSVEPHRGRGGWTWYTGSAGWMWRMALEAVLGVRLERGDLRIEARLPRGWDRISIEYAPETGTRYRIEVRREERADVRAALDGEALALDAGSVRVPVLRDGRDHHVLIVVP
ncbi:MAG: glucoamylase family protein [Gemmatimonadota bacterium]